MDCWICKRTALGVCRFCGRGICEEHARFHPYILSLYASHSKEAVKALVVDDALHCGVCKPRPDPVELPELE
jgi:hypothetical protein